MVTMEGTITYGGRLDYGECGCDTTSLNGRVVVDYTSSPPDLLTPGDRDFGHEKETKVKRTKDSPITMTVTRS